MAYAAPVRDQLFVLNEVLNIQSHANLAGFSDATPELVEQIVEEAAKFTESVLAPLNHSGDREGCRYDPATAEVATPKGFKEAFDGLRDAGWTALSIKPEWGGQGLPGVVNVAFGEMSSSANMA
ncbi:MAG: acyl-CoA dehydrogenase, partial [Caulobacteraceae bacterium]